MKQNLALKADFTLEACYKEFKNSSRKGYINFNDFEETFNKNGIYPLKEQIKLIFLEYDKNQDGKLDFQEFCHMIVPKD